MKICKCRHLGFLVGHWKEEFWTRLSLLHAVELRWAHGSHPRTWQLHKASPSPEPESQKPLGSYSSWILNSKALTTAVQTLPFTFWHDPEY